jgi:hypothetical protein
MIGLQIFTIYNYQFTIVFTPFTLYPHPHSSVGQASPCTIKVTQSLKKEAQWSTEENPNPNHPYRTTIYLSPALDDFEINSKINIILLSFICIFAHLHIFIPHSRDCHFAPASEKFKNMQI